MHDFAHVRLLNEDGSPKGLCEKLLAHREGVLHRAFSIFVFNARGELLLQRRAREKYHSGGLWSNTCCGHPLEDAILPEAQTRLLQEMGFACALTPIFRFTYRAEMNNGLLEHETDDVLLGLYDGPVRADPREADDWRWSGPAALAEWIRRTPEEFTAWFREALPSVTDHMKEHGHEADAYI